jgi:hypothetical protein
MKIPYPRELIQNGTFLYAWSLEVPPSAFQSWIDWPTLLKAPNLSPKPYTDSPTESVDCVKM